MGVYYSHLISYKEHLYIIFAANMREMTNPTAILLLEDGTAYYGKAAGTAKTVTGEICFNTGMTGYQEVFTDPSYFGQILIMTNVHIGNYGTRDSDSQSARPQINGLVVRNFTDEYSRPLADQSIQAYCERDGLSAIYDLDTRAVVRHIRDKGAMNAIISSETLDIQTLKKQLKQVPSMQGLELASKVSTDQAYIVGPTEGYKAKIAALDLGIKKNILNCFTNRNCQVKVFPAQTPISELMKYNPDGFFLSNGPGDPSAMEYAIKTAQDMMNTGKPIFGICLGHQILALSLGIETYKMHNGHRGINHPVINKVTGKSEITSQNHGFGVSPESLDSKKDELDITHVNLNDGTVEGISLKKYPAFSVQYHPEAAPGPHDSRYLFDDYLKLLLKHQVPATQTV